MDCRMPTKHYFVQLSMKRNVSAAYPRTGRHDFTSSDKDLYLNFHRYSTVFCCQRPEIKTSHVCPELLVWPKQEILRIIKISVPGVFPIHILGGFWGPFRLPCADVTQLLKVLCSFQLSVTCFVYRLLFITPQIKVFM